MSSPQPAPSPAPRSSLLVESRSHSEVRSADTATNWATSPRRPTAACNVHYALFSAPDRRQMCECH